MEVRLLFIISNTHIGGAENLLLQYVSRLRKYVPNWILDCYITHEKGLLHDEYVRCFDNVIFNSEEESINELMKYDLIHIFGNLAFALKVSIVIEKPIILSIFQDVKEGFDSYLEQIKNYVDVIILQSKSNYHVVKRWDDTRCRVEQIPSGIDIEFWKAEDNAHRAQKSICWVGRLSEIKGVDILKVLINRLPDYQFNIVSNYELSEHNGFLMSKKNVNFHWALNKEALMGIYCKSRIFLHTSRSESMPTALIEAMACGCLPVCNDIPGVREVLRGRLIDHGILIENNQIETCIKHIRATEKIDVLEEVWKMRQRVSPFSLDENIKAHLKVYEEILKCE